MARKKTEPKPAVVEQEAEHPYADYQPPAVADQVEVRINNKIVYLDKLYGARLETSASGIQVHGGGEPPKETKQPPKQHIYNPVEDELPGANTVTGTTESTVPVADSTDTEELAAQFDDEDRD